MSKKPFKDTKVGKFLMKKLPDFAGAALTGGPLEAIKSLINEDTTITPEEKAQLHEELVELYKLEVEDRDSARKREIEVAKTGRFDFMYNLTGIIGLGAFAFIVYAIVYLEIPAENKEVWIHLIGICEGIVLSIFGYFYGSAVKRDKD
jgi:hypothetical protein